MRSALRRLSTTNFFALTCVVSVALARGDEPLPVDAKCSDSNCTTKCSRSGPWFVADTANFQACCLDSESTAKLLARSAEGMRTKLLAKWLGDEAPKPWTPKCQIVLHRSLESYVSACGRGSEHTVGSSLVKTEEGQIGGRRIDLLGDRADFLSAALPHELTHVVLKDRFLTAAMPRWADEGAAVLADTDAKQGRHLQDLKEALARNTTFDAAVLMTLEDYPSADRVGTFYGQSASLTEFLVEQGKAAQFVEFVQRAGAKGYDAALRECYGISDVHELDRLWRKHVYQTLTAQTEKTSAVLAAR